MRVLQRSGFGCHYRVRREFRSWPLSKLGRAISIRSNTATGSAGSAYRDAGFEAARAEAIRCAIGALVDMQPGDELTEWLVRIRDKAGNDLCTIAEAKPHGRPTKTALGHR